MKLSDFVLMLVVMCFVVGCETSLAGEGGRDRPNIVMILVDDMGYGDLGCYNAGSKIPTPHIDGLAKAGLKFTDAHAAGSVCHPSRYGLMTGQFPYRANVGKWRTEATIAKDRLTVGKLLQKQGYRTAMVGKWHLGFDEDGYDKPLPGGPADRGFDTYFGIRASTDIPPYFYIRGREAVMPPTEKIGDNFSEVEGWNRIQGAFWRAGGIAPDLKLEEVLPRFTDEAVKVIANHEKEGDGKPLFMYLAYPAPHTPWLPSEEFVGKSGAGMYGDFMVMVDAMVGRVLKQLEKSGMSGETMVIFSSDNGPVWYDKDVKRFGHDSVGGLRGMKGDAYEGGHRMPFIVRWPGKVKGGRVSDEVICFTDMLATFAALTGYELGEDDGPDSFNALPVILGKGKGERVRESLVLQSSGGVYHVRMGDWKLIDNLGSGGFTRPGKVKPKQGEPKGQLFNLKDDVVETKNVYAAHPEVVAKLMGEIERVRNAKRTR